MPKCGVVLTIPDPAKTPPRVDPDIGLVPLDDEDDSPYALPGVPKADDIGELLDAAGNALDKIIPLHYRLVGRLALATEEVEKILGMDPLPEIPKDESGKIP